MKRILITLSIAAALSGCVQNTSQKEDTNVAVMMSSAEIESNKLKTIVENGFEESIALSPLSGTFVGQAEFNDKFNAPISNASREAEKALNIKFSEALNEVDPSLLSGQDLLTYEIFKRDREITTKGFGFPEYMMPLNQMYGIHNTFASLGSGQSAQPFNTMEDYDNFIKRSAGFAVYMDSAITAMRDGMKEGVVLPNVLLPKIIPQFEAHVVDQADKSIFYGPVTMLDKNDAISAEDKVRIKKNYDALIMEVLVPSYQRFATFLKNEYVGRESVGLSALPNGKSWYQYKIETHTTLPLTAEELHQYGLEEVARIRSEMEKVRVTVGFEGDLAAFFTFLKEDDQFYFESEEALIAGYTDIKNDINARLPKLFEVFPKADYEVKAVEPFRAASSAGASYQSPAPDGSRPGIFYINGYNLKAQPKFLMETLSIHEASPGHHFQISIQQEVKGLPSFRKFGGETVFAEGWALYAESLGKELGMFTDPYMWYGRLSDEQLRAMRLVVDTGLHHYGWSREKAIQFMLDNSSIADSDIEAEVERYIAIPGQALAYKTGQRAIRGMRTQAEATLGDKFDVKKFHTQILIDGSLPMPILQAKIDKWIADQTM